MSLTEIWRGENCNNENIIEEWDRGYFCFTFTNKMPSLVHSFPVSNEQTHGLFMSYESDD